MKISTNTNHNRSKNMKSNAEQDSSNGRGPRYPNVTAQLTGRDGNAYAVIGGVSKAMRRAGISGSEIARFRTEATSGDYDHVLVTAMRWVNVDD